jgi:hypothetical protein|tara:strand:+ start:2966 stop:3208 length:243 start_codon:yes stop_codon:yes gene_type:complete
MNISEEQLQKLNEFISSKEKTILRIGELEALKHSTLHHLTEIDALFNEFTKELSDEFGDVDIDIKTGLITPRDDKDKAVS